MSGRRKQRNNNNNGEERQPKVVAEKSVLLPVSTVSRLNNNGAPTSTIGGVSAIAGPKTIRKISSEERGRKHQESHEKKRRSKTYRKKGDRPSTKKMITKSKEGGRMSKARKDSSEKKRKHSKKPVPLEGGSERKTGEKGKQPSASGTDCNNTHDSDLDQESVVKHKKKKLTKNELMTPKASGAGGAAQMDNNPSKAGIEDDETLISVDAEMPELALPTYVLPEGEFEDPAPLGNESSKKHRHTKE